MSWVFHESDPMGGAAGEAYANTLKSPGMEPEHVLAREAIQNSVDAREGQVEKVKVTFRAQSLKNNSKRRFVEAAHLADIAARLNVLELSAPNCLASLSSPAKPLEVLYVEDYKTQGLSGDAHDSQSNFYRLLLSLGDRSKARRAEGSGGSYGFGKSVYSSSSSIQTIFAYTRFKDQESGRSRSRLFGCGYYASHEHKGKGYSGRAWLGKRKPADAQGRVVVDPFEDSAAEALARELGFAIRKPADTGTTILIVDSTVNFQKMRTGIEDWWWPRLVEDALDVELIDHEAKIISPRPRKREDLRPFIDAYDVARERATPIKGQQKFDRPNKIVGKSIGSCGFMIVPLTPEGPVVPEERLNTVAMIRTPLMVVAYKRFSETSPHAVGAFVADPEVDGPLKLSEPPAHDKWDPDSSNLRDSTGESASVVQAVLSRVKAALKRFQQEAAPPPPPKQKRLNLLERALASFFKPAGAGTRSQPESTYSPLHVQFSSGPASVATIDGQLNVKASFTVHLDDRADQDVVKLRLRVASPILEDSDQEGDDVPLQVKCNGVPCEAVDSDAAAVIFVLAKGEQANFDVESAAYDPTWTVRIRPEIDLYVEGAK